MNTKTMSTMLITIFVMVGYMSILDHSLNLMSTPGNVEFYAGVLLLVANFITGWICLRALWEPFFKEYINENK